jgi:hypothetical protein
VWGHVQLIDSGNCRSNRVSRCGLRCQRKRNPKAQGLIDGGRYTIGSTPSRANCDRDDPTGRTHTQPLDGGRREAGGERSGGGGVVGPERGGERSRPEEASVQAEGHDVRTKSERIVIHGAGVPGVVVCAVGQVTDGSVPLPKHLSGDCCVA